MTLVWKLIGARQAGYGIGPTRPPVKDSNGYDWAGFITIRESFGDYTLSVELGRPGEVVGRIADDATEEQQFDTLAALEELGRTWAEQQALYAQYAREEEENP